MELLLIAPGSGELSIYWKAAKEFSIDVRFKLQDMIFDEMLEY